ncbi:PREDICTED: uncharacterized protein LOC109333904 [Lupinus angustifolius]|uniref:uncharacterized protein LOC109333904 n=1 Tax=Lupinus angustifolius TaxID=3871 RepID=UPI00092E966C|nr:PREDICTED: uncharacterized protein LOC109333904 [Lupinus angustifolius]
MKVVSDGKGDTFFLYGYGGTGKTFMWKTLSSALRSQNHIVLTVASSGIASLLLPGGRTTHSKFAIPVPTLENSTCNIHQGSELAGLLKQTKLIIWDEAPMTHKFCFEALDKTLTDIMSYKHNDNSSFGGKVIIFGGDFRQILPVIPRGSRSNIINATINASYIWDNCHVLTLTKNMCLQNSSDTTNEIQTKEFAKWILDVGDGKLSEPNDGYASIEIPNQFLITEYDDPIHAIVKSTYPNLENEYLNEEFLQCRAILASTIETVDEINDYVLSLIPGEEIEYLSSDSVDRSECNDNEALDGLTPEFLNSLRTSGLPNHKIKLKIGTPIMLMRNLDQSEGLCNGTRMIVNRAILASIIETIDEINDYVLSLIPGEEIEYLSSDSVDRSECNDNEALDELTPEFLNSLRTLGLPNHKIKLKIGTPIMLMRNLDQSEGLCNGTRMIVNRLANHVIEARVITGKIFGKMFCIPRMSLSPSHSPWPFKLTWRQFPLIVSYAMTINKSQGQSLASVGLYLP